MTKSSLDSFYGKMSVFCAKVDLLGVGKRGGGERKVEKTNGFGRA